MGVSPSDRDHAAPSPPRCAGGKPRVRKLLPKMALLCGACVLVLLMLEGATRLFTHVVPPLLVNDPVVGMTFCPHFSGSVFVPESSREVFLRFNREGMRGPDWPYDKRPDVCRVAIVGDSMIAAIATEEEKTLVNRLGERLNGSAADPRFEILNFGVSGSSTGQELVLYREIVRKYHPDVVVCAFCVNNDFGDNCSRLTSNRGRIYFEVGADDQLVQVPLLPGRAALTSWLNRHSRFYVWQKDMTQRAINNLRGQAMQLAARAGHETTTVDSGGLGVFCSEPDDTLQYAWRVTEKLLAAMHQEVAADGVEFLIAAIPAGLQIYDDAWQQVEATAELPIDPRYPDKRLTAIARRLGVPLVLMTDEFRASAPHHSQAAVEEWLHYDAFGHLNDRGNDVAAEAVYHELLKRSAVYITRRPTRAEQ
ncbi:MAG TPA: SGNH/GDSL hydrolase family protein [Pirellulales bacterium]|nr:SGNH/GDSL hydrolase family protein [Pirellulales bacterium]